MKSEFVPKGYNSWHEYYIAKDRRQKWLEKLQIALTVIIFIGVVFGVGYVEGM